MCCLFDGLKIKEQREMDDRKAQKKFSAPGEN